MISNDSTQRSIQWFRSRMGYFTGSRVADLMKTSRQKGDPFSATAHTYIYQVAAERLFNPAFLDDDDIFQDYLDRTSATTRAMQWGIDMERQARQLYASLAPDGSRVEDVTSCRHDSIPFFAASPDAIVHTPQGARCLEIKCPSLATHMLYADRIRDAGSLKDVRPEYYWQIMAEMACTGTAEADFVSYCPWLTSPIHTAHILRSDDDMQLLCERVLLANELVSEIIDKQQ